MKKISIGLALVAVFALGIFVAKKYYQVGKLSTEQDAKVLLERIKTVAKLVTVEGYFSEIYTHKDYYHFDLSPFRKKALLRVRAKVSVGFNLESLKMEAKDKSKIIIISNIPDPEIISIDHEIDYYDMQEGTFNFFTEKELTELNKKAKEFIEKKALSDEIALLPAAEEQMNKMLKSIELIITTAGYTVQYQPVYKENKSD